ncbi:MAG TPA: DUF6580 family putative transport protein [Puia sp.]|nr:DUF6580 family putative transport protein [Puia sp.]
MKPSKTIIWSLVMLVIIASLYRVIPNRPYGFAPQWAMAVFTGAVIKDKKWAFIVPVLSMFISDLLYQMLYVTGVSSLPGFYEGQWQNYILFGLLPLVGMAIRKVNIIGVVTASLAAPTVYFLLSNFVLWAGWSGTRGLGRPKTFDGLMQCYNDAIPFYRTSLFATVIFSVILFGGYILLKKREGKLQVAR